MVTARSIFALFGFEADEKSAEKVEQRVDKLKSYIGNALGAIGIGLSLMSMNALVEEFEMVNRNLDNSIDESENLEEVQQKILKSATDIGMQYAAYADSVADLTKANRNLFPIDDAILFTDTVSKTLKMAGKGEHEIGALMRMMSVSFQRGRVGPEVIMQMMRIAPDMANSLAEYLGVSTKRLQQLAMAHRISTAQLKAAVLSTAEEVDRKYAEIQPTISETLAKIRNGFGDALYRLNKTSQATSAFAKIMSMMGTVVIKFTNLIAKGFEKIQNVVGGSEQMANLFMIILTGGAISTAIKNSKLVAEAFKTASGYLTKANFQIGLMMAKFIAVGLIVEDLIGFIEGKNSLTGYLFESSGIDPEGIRELLREIWDAVKEIFDNMADVGKNILPHILDIVRAVVGAIKPLMPIIKILLQMLSVIVSIVGPAVVFIIEKLSKGIGTIADFVQTIADVIESIFGKVASVITDVADFLGFNGKNKQIKKTKGIAENNFSIDSDEEYDKYDKKGLSIDELAMLAIRPTPKSINQTSNNRTIVINQKNEVKNTFNGDRDMQRNISKVNDGATDMFLDGITRGLQVG